MSEYRNPTPTVDVIVADSRGILLIERKNKPFGWALPGGFVDEGECLEAAALRELREETGLEGELRDLLYCYSRPDRDRRQHTISAVFIVTASGEPAAQDDAKHALFFPFDRLPQNICFDHREILEDFIAWRDSGVRVNPADKLRLYRKIPPVEYES